MPWIRQVPPVRRDQPARGLVPRAPSLSPPLMKIRTITLAATALYVILFCSGCAAVVSGITGQPIPATTVQRADGTGKPVQVSTSDLIRAELSPPESVWGLYNAGTVAESVEVSH